MFVKVSIRVLFILMLFYNVYRTLNYVMNRIYNVYICIKSKVTTYCKQTMDLFKEQFNK